jgi:hypothetical protein
MNTFFLLGGNDLEMQTIREILLKNLPKNEVLDVNLNWGAKLSDYKQFLNDDDRFVGIELIKDINPPKHYVEVDHHNENSKNPTSLAQILRILEEEDGIHIDFDRQLQLISANDLGHIKALEEMGATEKEIKEIRLRDRRAQGVTEEMEKIALEELKLRRTVMGITIIKTSLSHFSIFTDELYPYDELLIYNVNEVNYFGPSVDEIVKQRTISPESAFYRIDKSGFWGVSNIQITQSYIDRILRFLLKLKEPFYSYHIFSYTFTFDGESQKLIDQIKTISNCSSKGHWIDQSPSTYYTYNEKNYFHPFCQEEGHKLTSYFEFVGPARQMIYEIVLLTTEKDKDLPKKDQIKKKTYSLLIEKVTLSINALGAGILSFHLINPINTTKESRNTPKDVLLINQFGRRLYPPFFDLHPENNITKFPSSSIPKELIIEDDIDRALLGSQMKELPISISIKSNNWREENGTSSNSIPGKGIALGTNILRHLVSEKPMEGLSITEDFRSYIKRELENPGDVSGIGKIRSNGIIKHFLPVNLINNKGLIDDRMFVTCWFGSEQLDLSSAGRFYTKKMENEDFKFVLSDICQSQPSAVDASLMSGPLKPRLSHQENQGPGYLRNDFWYQYVFVDGGGRTCQNEAMQQKLMNSHTYARWLGHKTLFGITQYSFVCMTSSQERLNSPEVNASFLVDHVRTIYFRMVCQCLMQRALILKFSEDATRISHSIWKDNRQKNKILKKGSILKVLDDLMIDYNSFINQVYFREVTSQDQGLEMYDMLQTHMQIEHQAKELQIEINESHRQVENLRNKQSNEFKDILEILGILLVVPTLVFELLHTELLGIHEVNIKNFSDSYKNHDLIAVVSTILFLIIVLRQGLKELRNKKITLIPAILIIANFFLFYAIIETNKNIWFMAPFTWLLIVPIIVTVVFVFCLWSKKIFRGR